MDCKHKLEDLMGVEGGVICRKCGKHFDHIPKQEVVPVQPKPEKIPAPEAQPEQEAAPAEKKSIRKTAARKGGKK